MDKKGVDLKKLKGVGDVLARRLAEAGHDTFAKVAAAGEEGLKLIRGINPRMIPSILSQAAELAGEGKEERERRVAELKKTAANLKEQMQNVALDLKERFKDELAGKGVKKMGKELVKIIDSLGEVEEKLEIKVKRTGKSLAKAEKELAGLAEAGLKRSGKVLKKVRKSIQKVFA